MLQTSAALNAAQLDYTDLFISTVKIYHCKKESILNLNSEQGGFTTIK